MDRNDCTRLSILGGSAIIFSFFGYILILIMLVYIILLICQGMLLGTIYFIILIVCGCVAIGGGISIIIGTVLDEKDDYKRGKLIVDFGLIIGLIGLIIFIGMGLNISSIYSSFTKYVVVIIFLFFSLGFSGFLLAIFSQINILQIEKDARAIEVKKKRLEKPEELLEEFAFSIDKLRKEALEALIRGRLIMSHEKFQQIENKLSNYILKDEI